MQAEAQSGEKSQTTRAHARCVENVVWTLPRWKAWNTGLGFPEKSNQQNPYISSPGSPRSADSKDPGELMLQNRSKSKSKARAHRCTSLRTIRQRERERERERGKIVSSLASAFCSVQARSRLEEVHSHWGGQGALFTLRIQTLISSRNTLGHTPRNNRVSVAQPSGHVVLTRSLCLSAL